MKKMIINFIWVAGIVVAAISIFLFFCAGRSWASIASGLAGISATVLSQDHQTLVKDINA